MQQRLNRAYIAPLRGLPVGLGNIYIYIWQKEQLESNLNLFPSLLLCLWLPSRIRRHTRSGYHSPRKSRALFVPATLPPSLHGATVAGVSSHRQHGPAVKYTNYTAEYCCLFLAWQCQTLLTVRFCVVCAVQLTATARWNQRVYCSLTAAQHPRKAQRPEALHVNQTSRERTMTTMKIVIFDLFHIGWYLV